MNGLGKPFRKKSDPKNRKNTKNQREIAACEKTTSEKANFCSNTVFSLYFKIRAKKIHAPKPLAFSLHFLFRRDQNHYSNLTSKIMKMCEQILKKKTAPQYNSNSLNCKKKYERNNSRLRRWGRLINNKTKLEKTSKGHKTCQVMPFNSLKVYLFGNSNPLTSIFTLVKLFSNKPLENV